MRNNRFFLLLFLLLLITNTALLAQPARLWYRQPANALVPDTMPPYSDDPEWIKALPLGNGQLGAMVFGDVNQERVQLNEKSLWSGGPSDNDNPEAAKFLPQIRALLFAGKFKEATELTNKTQVCAGAGSGYGSGANVPFGCYQTLGDLRLQFDQAGAFTDYRRELDLNEAMVKVQYRQKGVLFEREYFVSTRPSVLVVRIRASKKGAISFTASIDRPERFSTTATADALEMKGVLNNGSGGAGMQYAARLQAQHKGGSLLFRDGRVYVKGADEVILFLSAATDYLPVYPVYKGNNYQAQLSKELQQALKTAYSSLRTQHIRDHQYYYKRVQLQLAPATADTLPTDERLQRIHSVGDDPFLSQLYFHYGRYLLIASARPNTLPANLQGIWANKIQTPWNADYHTNINVQMNYWPAEVCNLGDIHLSLIRFIQSLQAPATRSAAVQFGMRGWCINTIVNVWGFTAPGEHPSWGLTPGTSGWIARHLWEHYLFTNDETYLREVYPLLKEGARFYMDWLVPDPVSQKLVSGPAASPENSFEAPDGSRGTISMGPSHDQEVIDELFGSVEKAALVLNDKDPFVDSIRTARSRLLQPVIGKDGRLQEWAQPYDEPEPGHRHISHLYALYPGQAISMQQTPALAEATRRSLEYRLQHGGGHTGWSAAWVGSLRARLLQGNEALKAINEVLIKKSAPNLFDLHPPFQIDGNLGVTAAVAEMLLQSQAQHIQLLPALPDSWADGHVTGLCAQGGVEIDITWKKGKLVRAKLHSRLGGVFTIKYADKTMTLSMKAGSAYQLNNLLQVL
ncbi:MAG: glycoside hydrolase family 95 protein [Chitinophagaceae bacterium]|nr:glycoside hydrolase family 95 protein [Chitinophagaceae bacterium]